MKQLAPGHAFTAYADALRASFADLRAATPGGAPPAGPADPPGDRVDSTLRSIEVAIS